MSVDGTWKLSMQTPIGERKSTLALQSSGGALTGKLTAEEGNATDIYEGKLDGDTAAWKADIKNPMPLTLAFTGNRERRQDFRHRQRRRHRQLAVQRHQIGPRFRVAWATADVAELPSPRLFAGWSRPDTGRQVPRILQMRCGSKLRTCSTIETPERDRRPAMTLLTVRHTTTYRYKQPVSFGEHRMMFRPRDSYDQKLLEAWLTIKPEPATHALGARRVRQLRDDRRFSRAGRPRSCGSRATSGWITSRPMRRTSRSRTTRRNIRSPMRPRR